MNENDYLKKEYEMLGIYISTHPLKTIKEKYNGEITDINLLVEDGYYNVIGKILLIENRKTKNNKDVISFKIEDDTSIIYLREYNNPDLYKGKFKKGDTIFANITLKNQFAYINNMKIMEVNINEKDNSNWW